MWKYKIICFNTHPNAGTLFRNYHTYVHKHTTWLIYTLYYTHHMHLILQLDYHPRRMCVKVNITWIIRSGEIYFWWFHFHTQQDVSHRCVVFKGNIELQVILVLIRNKRLIYLCFNFFNLDKLYCDVLMDVISEYWWNKKGILEWTHHNGYCV